MDDGNETEARPDAAPGLTCKGSDELLPFCSGPDCAEWFDCHGERLRGYFEPGIG